MLERIACVLMRSPPFSPVFPAALQAGGAALLEYLRQAGARVGAGDARARTPLHYAILFDNADAAKLLLRRGASRYNGSHAALNCAEMRPPAVVCQRIVHAVWHMLVVLFCNSGIGWIIKHPCRQAIQGLHGPYRPVLWQPTLL